MAFDFSGIFSTSGADVLAALRSEFGGIGKLITSPFVGFGLSHLGLAVSLACPAPEHEAYAEELIAFSKRYPDTIFVYVLAECFGGVCEYAGFVFRGGERIHDEPFPDQPGNLGALRRLVGFLGVQLGDRGYFEPLSRAYFFSPRGSAPPPPVRKSAPPTGLWAVWYWLIGGGPGAG